MATLNIKGFPDALHRKLKARARRKHRSLAQEITAILAESVSAGEGHSLQELRGLGRRVWEGVDANQHVERERSAWE